jgi:hypothetical protein
MNFIKRFIIFIYNLIFVQYYPKCDLRIHKNINNDPIIMINGLYNMQISQESFIQEMDIYNTTFLFNLLPAMNARMNAQFLYNKIYGGLIEIGKFSEYSEGVYREWSEKKPISFFCHSYGCSVLIELIKILLEKDLRPEKMIYKIVFLNPTFLAEKSNYILYENHFMSTFFSACRHTNTYPILKNIYNPRDCILKKNKLINFSIPVLKMYKIKNEHVFDTTDIQYDSSALDILNKYKITYKIFIGSITFDPEYILYNIIISPFYLLSSVFLNLPRINVFDGMSYYNLKFCQKNNFQIVNSLGHFDLFFDTNPCTFARNKLFYYDVIKYLRNKKISQEYEHAY